MKLLDVNLLLYAVNRDSVHHEAAKAWLEQTLSEQESVALSWVVVLAFLRLSTSAVVFPRPLTPRQALRLVDEWLDLQTVEMVNPGDRHWYILRSFLSQSGTAGNLTTDAHLAALAVEHGCDLCSADSDFHRFEQLRWVNPLTP